ncbi:MAG: phosphoglucomutase/phosphomannomutase family protein [Firmicutes bacterium]|nr:phosphoglucomutase/phosphomannomutase family protein [Bacillota bacterium]
MSISFGTDGWRGIMARDFTFDNVALVARAIGEYLAGTGGQARGVVVGYDRRFLSERFAETVRDVLLARGIPVYTCREAVPTPVAAFAVRHYGAAGAVMLTASHNPPEYNGIKFIPENGGPAPPEVTRRIEELIRRLGAAPADGRAVPGRSATVVDPRPPYLDHLARLVDQEAVGRAGLRVVVDAMHGAGAGYLEEALGRAGAEVVGLRTGRDPLFGGGLPDPAPERLAGLRERVRETGAHLGVALDGDADRFGLIDADGTYLGANQFLPVLYHHLLAFRGAVGPVARTVATTHLLDRIAARYGQPVVETPVGFKYIGRALEEGCILGGEESGGLSLRDHLPEKDGILAGLLAAEVRAVRGRPLGALLRELMAEFGAVAPARLDVHTDRATRERVLEALGRLAPERLAGRRVVRRTAVDGVKLVLEDGSWVLVRASGTEPLFRLYAETPDPDGTRALQEEVRRLLGL